MKVVRHLNKNEQLNKALDFIGVLPTTEAITIDFLKSICPTAFLQNKRQPTKDAKGTNLKDADGLIIFETVQVDRLYFTTHIFETTVFNALKFYVSKLA
jgi:hypothetical protein